MGSSFRRLTAPCNAMFARAEVLSKLPATFQALWLLLGNFNASPLESTLLQLLILSNLKSFRINTYAKPRGGSAASHRFLLRVNSNVHNFPSCSPSSPRLLLGALLPSFLLLISRFLSPFPSACYTQCLKPSRSQPCLKLRSPL